MASRTGASSLARLAALAIALVALTPLAAEAATATRISDFRYDSTTGLLDRERVEPDTASLRLATLYAYDAFGNKVSATVQGSGIATRVTSTAYDAEGRFPVTNTNALSQSESMVHDPAFGNLLSQTGPNGLTTSWDYDSFGRKVLETRADGTKTAFAYTYCSGVNGGSETCPTHGAYVVTVTPLKADGVTANGPVSKSYHDRMGRGIATDTEGFSGAVIRQVTEYDHFGRVERASRPYFLSSGTPKWTTNTYDVLGRVIETVLPDGSETVTVYQGQTTIVTNDKGQTKTTVMNAQGLVASVTDAIGKSTTYEYDPFGNLTVTADSAGNEIVNTYDQRGRKIAMSDPDMGDWTYSYNVLDELIGQTDAKSQTTSFVYDLLGRMTSRVEPGLTSTWEYDTAANGIGKLAMASTNAGYWRQHFYDSLGRPSQSSTSIVGDMSSVTTYYDADGRVSMIGYPAGFTLEYVYNARGYVTQIKNAASGDPIWTANTYDAEMRILAETAGNAVVTYRSYDADTGFLTGIQAGVANAVADFAYTYDALSNLTSRMDANESLAETFLYDDLNRLTEYAITGGSTKTVEYDDLGNITFKSDVGSYSYNASGPASVRPHAVAAIVPGGTGLVNATYTYDANGNMTSGNGRTTTWTSFNKVASITRGTATVSFDYNGEHTRIRQVTASQTTLYITDPATGVSLEKVTGSSGSIQWNLYVRVGDRLVAQRIDHTPAGGGASSIAMRYFTTDHLGSVAVITDELGAVVERLSFDAWGKRRHPDGTDDPSGSITSQTSRGFTGHEMIDEVGLVNMNGRVYDPEIGRFMSADPFVQDPTNTQSLNRYSYVGNNPLSYTDPSGYFSLGKFLKTIIAIVVVVVAAIYGAGWVASAGLAAQGSTAAYAIAGAIGGAIAGGITGGNLRSVLTGAVSGAVAGGFGRAAALGKVTYTQQVVAVGMTGGVTSVIQGGNFQSGFLAASFSAIAAPYIDQVANDNVIRTAAAAVVGGTASVLGGGKFANGAVTGAFSYAVGRAIGEPANDYEPSKSSSGLKIGTPCSEYCDDAQLTYAANGPVPVGPGGEPYVPWDMLPKSSQFILRYRVLDVETGEIILSTPPSYHPVEAPEGGGILFVPRGWQPGDNRNVIRVQPYGTGSSIKHGYSNGYYVVTNQAGAAISIWSGRAFPQNSPAVHNPFGRAVKNLGMDL